MNKHQLPQGKFEREVTKAYLKNVKADINAMVEFHDKAIADIIEMRRTGKVDGKFNGFISRLKDEHKTICGANT